MKIPTTTIRLLLFLTLAFSLQPLAFSASYRYSATVTVTNAPTTNGQTLTVNGSTRQWTNNVTLAPGTYILTNATAIGSTTNLFQHLATYRFSSSLNATYASSNAVKLQAAIGQALTVTAGGSWASVVYATQLVNEPFTVPVRIPMSVEPATNATNIASQLVSDLYTYATNLGALAAITNAPGSNSTIKPLLVSPTDLRLLESGSNVLVTLTPTSLVVNASFGIGAGTWTNADGLIYTTNWPRSLQISNGYVQLGNQAFDGGNALFYLKRTSTNVANLNTFRDTVSGTPGTTVGLKAELLPAGYSNNWSMAGAFWNRLPTCDSAFPTVEGRALYFLGGAMGLSGLVNYFAGGHPLTNGEAAGVSGFASTDFSLQYGLVGSASALATGQTNIGVAGEAIVNSKTGTFIGGYFGIGPTDATNPVYESSVLLLDNRKSGLPLLVGRTNNGTTVFKVDRFGDLTTIKKVAYTWPTNYGAPGAELTDTNGAGALAWSNGKKVYAWQTNAAYTLTTGDYYLGVDSTGAAVTISLPTAASSSNSVWIIKDEGGAAAGNKIGLLLQAGDGIEGAITNGISSNYGTLRIISRGNTNFFLW